MCYGSRRLETNAIDPSSVIVFIVRVINRDLVFVPCKRCPNRIDNILVGISQLGQEFLDAKRWCSCPFLTQNLGTWKVWHWRRSRSRILGRVLVQVLV
jgi:hypothetical protein